MASVVCQGLQSCLDPTESIDLIPELPSKSTNLPQKLKSESDPNNGLGFFNVLENPKSNHVDDEEVYIHPMVKRSASALSTLSLEMCTESLGTETGSDVSESSDEFNWEERERFAGLLRSKSHRKTVSRRVCGGGGGFPPPLTSISGADGTVKVRPHRVGGRLVIKAVSVSVSDCGTKFEAQRTNGRLSLSLVRDRCVNVESRRVKNKGGVVTADSGGRWLEMDGDALKDGSKSKIRSSDRKSRLTNSVDDSTEFGLTRCKDGRNGNKGIQNWSLLRVVIS